jgi:poly(3-hydroxybutyrate) depolymerase
MTAGTFLLQMHGSADPVIKIHGGPLWNSGHTLSATKDSIRLFAAVNGCGEGTVEDISVDGVAGGGKKITYACPPTAPTVYMEATCGDHGVAGEMEGKKMEVYTRRSRST